MLLCFLIGSPLLSNGFPFVVPGPLHFSIVLSYVLLGSPLFSNGFPSFFYWVRLCFLTGSPLLSISPPLSVYYCPPLFLSELSYEGNAIHERRAPIRKQRGTQEKRKENPIEE